MAGTLLVIIIAGLYLWFFITARVHPVHAVTAKTALVAADLWTKPVGLSQKPTCRQPVNYSHPPSPFVIQPRS